MERVCRSCGKKFDSGEVSVKQHEFFGYNICRECWQRSSGERVSIDYLDMTEVSFSGQWQNYGICYVDMVDSTTITAGMAGAKVSQYYAIFLNSMGSIARNFNATTIKNIGDSLICYFPRTSDSTDITAFQDLVDCCIAMTEAHGIINRKLYAEGLPALNYRISADYGRLEIGRSRNSQSDDLFGSTMNLCAKINYMAPLNGIVIGGDLYRILKSFMFDADYHFEEVGAYSLGFQQRYPVYSMLSSKNSTENPFRRISRSEQVGVHSERTEWKDCSYNIMLIDDEPDILFVFKSILGSEGYNVDVFADTESALEHFTKMGPLYYDLVITDIRMQNMNGLEFYEKIKTANEKVKMLFISALDVAEELISYLPEVKRSDLLRKPVSREKLAGIVKAKLS
jgi:CheY-like chemotaxis protein